MATDWWSSARRDRSASPSDSTGWRHDHENRNTYNRNSLRGRTSARARPDLRQPPHPLLSLHASPVVYAILTLTAIVEGLAGAWLARAYVKRVSIGVWSDRLVFDYLGRSQSTIALDGAFAAEAVSVEFRWLFLVLRMRYIVFLRRDSAYVQTLDAAEWPAPALDSLIDHFRMRGVPIRGDWNGPSLRLFGPGPSLGSRYSGATRLRTGPYSLQAVSAAILISSAGLLIALPFAVG